MEYRIKYRKVGENVAWQTTTTTTSSHVITGLDSDTVYEFKVEARCKGELWATESDSAGVKIKTMADGESFADLITSTFVLLQLRYCLTLK